MTRIPVVLAIFTVAAAFALRACAEEAKTTAAAAVYSHTSTATSATSVAWPGYYNYGVYYGSDRWRYQPYYSHYASPWFDYGVQYTPYWYAGPGYGYGGYAPYTFAWPYYGAYGYTYYGPLAATGVVVACIRKSPRIETAPILTPRRSRILTAFGWGATKRPASSFRLRRAVGCTAASSFRAAQRWS